MDKIEVEPVPPLPECEDTPELRAHDLLGYGMLILRDGKRIDPQMVYHQRPMFDPPNTFTYVRRWDPTQE